MTYDLTVRGYLDFQGRTAVHSQRRMARDPLSGVVDGVNTVFFTNYAPLVTSGSLIARVGNSLVGGSADFDTGEVILASPPTAQPTASYTFTPYTTTQVMQILIGGFREMELHWQRGWRLVDATGAVATETSANILIVDTSGSSPTCGLLPFHQNQVQIGFYQLCCLLSLYDVEGVASAIGDFDMRESRGLSVDKSRRPSNIRRGGSDLDDRINRALVEAMDNYYLNGEQYGGAVHDPHTLVYNAELEWQTDAKDGLTYAVSRRPLCV